MEELQAAIAPLKKEIVLHPMHDAVRSLEHVRVFMEHHVFAVWDFMSLLKALQVHLTCTTWPWMPKGDATTRFLINEIVCGEESDTDENGVRLSHFEMYLNAMREAGANQQPILDVLHSLRMGSTIDDALRQTIIPDTARMFVRYTFDVINSGKPHVMAAVFTFGREDLIPDMFLSLVRTLQQTFPDQLSGFLYYLERHIEVDGGHHSQLALKMTASLCGSDPQKWEEATSAVLEALRRREALWQGVYNQISEE